MGGVMMMPVRAGQTDRPASDFYPTPHECTEALLRYLELPDGTLVWDPAAGEGNIVSVLERYNMICTGTDIETGLDFLKAKAMPGPQEWIITCPPWSQASNFVAAAARFRIPFAMLLPSVFWQSRSRTPLFYRCKPACVLPLTWRPDSYQQRTGGRPWPDVMWVVWDRGMLAENHGLTTFGLLDKPEQRRLPTIGGMDIQVDRAPGGHQAHVAGEFDFR